MSEYRRKLMMAYAANNRSDDIIYPGLIAAWDIQKEGKDNYHPDREWARDLTGNGHDIQWKNLAFSEMSGYGGYKLNLLKLNGNQIRNQELHSNRIVLKTLSKRNEIAWINNVVVPKIPKLKWKVSNVKQFIDRYPTSAVRLAELYITEDGIYEVNEKQEGFAGYWLGIKWVSEFGDVNTSPIDLGGIIIELLPEYEGAICLDGVDDYGINENMPILQTLTDYTIIGKRKYLSSSINYVFMSCRSKGFNDTSGIFQFERNLNNINNAAISFGQMNYNINFTEQDITYQTKNSYNGKSIQSNSPFYTTSKELSIGSLYNGHSSRIKMAFYSAYLFDRSLDEQEIKSFIRKYIDSKYYLPSEVVTPDCYYDFSKGSNDSKTRETITDYSGNGNDAKAYNFAWKGNSGYGGYPFVWSEFTQEAKYDEFVYENNKVTIKNSSIPLSMACLYKLRFIGTNFKIKVTNKPDDITLQIGSLAAGKQELFNGENTITLTFSNMSIGLFVTPCTDQNIIIEILPEYPGALVLDGVDDYISLEAFSSGFATMFMVCKVLSTTNQMLYDQRKSNPNNKYALYIESGNDLAYNSRNVFGTYINEKYNTYTINQIGDKKHLIRVKMNETPEIIKPIIGANIGHNMFFTNMAIYKFLGFKDELTEEQIQYVIEKYNLLDGVDNIEVS